MNNMVVRLVAVLVAVMVAVLILAIEVGGCLVAVNVSLVPQ